jgi:viroplasmin and RNaseH domain-containing protein
MKFYAVKVGRGAPVITNTWDECNSLVNGFSGAIF